MKQIPYKIYLIKLYMVDYNLFILLVDLQAFHRTQQTWTRDYMLQFKISKPEVDRTLEGSLIFPFFCRHVMAMAIETAIRKIFK